MELAGISTLLLATGAVFELLDSSSKPKWTVIIVGDGTERVRATFKLLLPSISMVLSDRNSSIAVGRKNDHDDNG